jgi:ABC-type Fe3+-siderophore transport system permease subunit
MKSAEYTRSLVTHSNCTHNISIQVSGITHSTSLQEVMCLQIYQSIILIYILSTKWNNLNISQFSERPAIKP